MSWGSSLYSLLPPSTGAEKYASPLGSDTTGTGTFTNPWASFQKLLDTLTAGQVGYMMEGIYTPPSGNIHNLSTGRSGTSLNPIEVRAYPGATVRIRPNPTTGAECLIINSGASASSFWRFRNLIFEYAGTNGTNPQNIYVAGTTAGSAATDIEFWNCEARYAQKGTGIFFEEGTRRIHFINGSVHDNYDVVVPGQQRQGMYVTGNESMVLNTLLYNHEGFGIQIRSNTAQRPTANIVANCTAYNNLGIVNPGVEFAGFMIEEDCDDNKFRNNISVGNRNGFRGLDAGSTPSPHNIAAFNIAFGNVAGAYTQQAGGHIALDYDKDGDGVYTSAGDNITTDPKLRDPAHGIFEILAGSSAINYGDPDFMPSFDIRNLARTELGSGAHAFSSGTQFTRAEVRGGGF